METTKENTQTSDPASEAFAQPEMDINQLVYGRLEDMLEEAESTYTQRLADLDQQTATSGSQKLTLELALEANHLANVANIIQLGMSGTILMRMQNEIEQAVLDELEQEASEKN